MILFRLIGICLLNGNLNLNEKNSHMKTYREQFHNTNIMTFCLILAIIEVIHFDSIQTNWTYEDWMKIKFKWNMKISYHIYLETSLLNTDKGGEFCSILDNIEFKEFHSDKLDFFTEWKFNSKWNKWNWNTKNPLRRCLRTNLMNSD